MPMVKGRDGKVHLTTFEDGSVTLCGEPVVAGVTADASDIHPRCQEIEDAVVCTREREVNRSYFHPSSGFSMEEAIEEAHRSHLDDLHFEPPYDPMN